MLPFYKLIESHEFKYDQWIDVAQISTLSPDLSSQMFPGRLWASLPILQLLCSPFSLIYVFCIKIPYLSLYDFYISSSSLCLFFDLCLWCLMLKFSLYVVRFIHHVLYILCFGESCLRNPFLPQNHKDTYLSFC